MKQTKKLIILFILALLCCVSGCQQSTKKEQNIVIDFAPRDSLEKLVSSSDSTNSLRVAVSAIISPRETYLYYEELLKYISQKANYNLKIMQRKTYSEVNKMLVEGEVDLAFICSGAYVRLPENSVDILAVPVCDSLPFYQAYIIANKQSDIHCFNDFRGKTFAFTDPLSNTGKLYIDHKLNSNKSTEASFFSSTIYTHAHDISIQLVAKNMVDGATIDGLIYEYLAQSYPERVNNIKVIEKSDYFGIPPIVVPSKLPSSLKLQLKNILLTIHKDPEGAIILKKLQIDKFIEGDDKNYDSVRKILSFN